MRAMLAVTTVFIATLLSGGVTPAATLVLQHDGQADPASEGFTLQAFGAVSSGAPVASDLGLPAWNITGSARSSQLVYLSGALSNSEKAMMAAHGFTLTAIMRPIQGLAPVYTAAQPVVIASANVNIDSRRYELDLGLSASGDIVAVLPSSQDNNGPGASTRSFGQSVTVTNGYHTYALTFDPVAQSADLWVDGIDLLQGYSGYTAGFIKDDGLHFAAGSGGEGNFNQVTLTSVPEPSTIALAAAGLAAIGFLRLRRRISG
jgi:hypothetical protein